MNTNKAWGIAAISALVFSLTACNGTDRESAPAISADNSLSSSFGNTAASSSQNTSEPAQSVPESSPGVPQISAGTVSTDTSYTPPNNDGNGEVLGSILVLDGGRAMMLYNIDREFGQKYAETVNKYKEQLGANVNVYSMIVPTQLSFYLPESCSEMYNNEVSHIADIYGSLDGVIPIDVFAALKGHVSEDIYYRTDHHWTQLGAYYAAKSFAETALVPFDELSAYERNEKAGYLGSFYGASGKHPEIKNNPETFVWYIPKRAVSTEYYDNKFEYAENGSYFLDPDDIDTPLHWLDTYAQAALGVHISTGLDTGRKLMMIKDSYADMLAPSLFGSFDEVWIVDARFCTTSAVRLAKENGITDLLFCCTALSAAGSASFFYPEKIM